MVLARKSSWNNLDMAPLAAVAIATFGLLLYAIVSPIAAVASPAKTPWPPPPDQGAFYIHYGEEHPDDADGPRIFGQVIRETARYRPSIVTTSGDKGDDNTVETLTRWKEMMSLYDREGIPYFAAVGNHDRSPEGSSGIGSAFNGGSIGNYLDIFADRPFPFGDSPPPSDPRFSPSTRPAGDPAGASTRYAFEYGPVRYVVLDNSCFSFTTCDDFQSPAFAPGEDTYSFLAAEAATADASGDLLFVVMHMPTQDDRPGHTEPTPSAHTMGEGSAPDNAAFEQAATAAGVDAVLLGHVKGQFEYEAGGVPYYTDGGAGGEVYVGDAEETGVDYGYWHGYRLITVRRGEITFTDTVPIFEPGGITVDGPARLGNGEVGQFSATGRQPTMDGPAVESLALREPDPARPNASKLPTPARIWRSGDPLVLAPVAEPGDDPRRNPRRETVSGRFRARCPGKTTVKVKSGWEQQRFAVTVPSAKGPLVRSFDGGATLRPGERTTVARVRLAQAARVLVRIRDGGRTIRRLAYRCQRPGRTLAAAWNGTRRGGRAVAPGRYQVVIRVLSDRAPRVDRLPVRIRG